MKLDDACKADSTVPGINIGCINADDNISILWLSIVSACGSHRVNDRVVTIIMVFPPITTTNDMVPDNYQRVGH